MYNIFFKKNNLTECKNICLNNGICDKKIGKCKCSYGYTGEDCSNCLNKDLDPNQYCKTCLNKDLDPNQYCKTCLNKNFDYKSNCLKCVDPDYNLLTSCNWNMSADNYFKAILVTMNYLKYVKGISIDNNPLFSSLENCMILKFSKDYPDLSSFVNFSNVDQTKMSPEFLNYANEVFNSCQKI